MANGNFTAYCDVKEAFKMVLVGRACLNALSSASVSIQQFQTCHLTAFLLRPSIAFNPPPNAAVMW